MEPDLTRMKLEINNMMWTLLPETTTIKKAEELSVQVFEMITYEYEKIDKNKVG